MLLTEYSLNMAVKTSWKNGVRLPNVDRGRPQGALNQELHDEDVGKWLLLTLEPKSQCSEGRGYTFNI